MSAPIRSQTPEGQYQMQQALAPSGQMWVDVGSTTFSVVAIPTNWMQQNERPELPPGSYQTPYGSASFSATQRFWWSCPNYDNGADEYFVPDVTITRTVFQDTDGPWKYKITKSGYTNIVALPNQ